MPEESPGSANGSRRPIHAIVPALNEEQSIAAVVTSALSVGVDAVIVVDNGSTDMTSARAIEAGAQVVFEPRRGYGAACQAGIDSLRASPAETIILFLDGDGADDPSEISRLTGPLQGGEADMVLGSRTLGDAEPGSLTMAQRCGNWLATRLLSAIYKVECTDLGPMRAIGLGTLRALDMRDRGFGWTMEMQVRAAVCRLRVVEVPVHYRNRRAGTSKISGTIVGSARAGVTILWTLASAGRRRGDESHSLDRPR